MGVTVKWGSYGKYSGPYIIGTRNTPVVAAPDPGAPFMMRAFWLTSMAECLARFGVVNMRDGTGVTAGLHQAVACLPRSTKAQGDLFKMLWRLNQCVDLEETRVGSLLAGQDWFLGAAGVLVDAAGRPVSGSEFRAVVTPPGGVTPNEGPDWRQARLWAVAFHELFVDERTHRAQILCGMEWLTKRVCRSRNDKYLHGATIEEVAFRDGAHSGEPFMTPEADLAHALLMSFAVNAPTWAFQAYDASLKKAHRRKKITYSEANLKNGGYVHDLTDDPRFAKDLIKALANKSKKWDDDVRGSRYHRSRDAAMDIWESYLFEDRGVMPADLID